MTDYAFIVAAWSGGLALLGGLAFVAWTDFRTRRIPNAVTMSLLALGLLWNGLAPTGYGIFDPTLAGGIGWTKSILGALAAFAGFFLFYLLRILGAGDVKLMAAVGAWVGYQQLPGVVLLVLLAGGVLALSRMIDSSRRTQTLINLHFIAIQHLPGMSGSAPLFDPKTDSADRLPYAWAIGAGVVVFACVRTNSWWSWL